MSEFYSDKIIMEPIIQEFLDYVNAMEVPPIYELSPADARNVLQKFQDIDVNKLPAEVEDIKIPSTSGGEISLRIFRPLNCSSKLPTVVYFHGGGWILGDKNTHDRLVREIAVGAQAVVILVNFSRSPEARYPVAIEEAYEATKYVFENAEALNLDSSKLAVAGDSVGGNMATVVTILAKERRGPKIDYQVLFYPVTAANFKTESYNTFAKGYWLTKEAMKWFWDAYLPDVEARNKYTVSPLLAYVEQLQSLPPALVITNEYDVLRDEGEAYAHKLMEAGNEVTAVRLLGTIHDCLLLNALAESTNVKSAIALANAKLREAFNH